MQKKMFSSRRSRSIDRFLPGVMVVITDVGSSVGVKGSGRGRSCNRGRGGSCGAVVVVAVAVLVVVAAAVWWW